MKKIFIVLFFLFSTYSSFSQTFSFVRTSPAIVEGRADTTSDSWAHVNNLTSNPIPIAITISNMIVQPGWDTIAMCTWAVCYAPGVLYQVENCPPGQHDFHLYLNPYGVPGNGGCRVTMSHQSTTVSQDFGFHINPVGIHQISTIVMEFSLSQNYPNPFNPATKINFSIPKSDYVSLRVYDILGREVNVLVNENLAVGEYEVDFDASKLSSGMYYYSLRSGDFVSVKKMVLVK